MIAKRLGWDFMEFFYTMWPVVRFVWPAGVATCLVVESTQINGYGQSPCSIISGHLAESSRNDCDLPYICVCNGYSVLVHTHVRF